MAVKGSRSGNASAKNKRIAGTDPRRNPNATAGGGAGTGKRRGKVDPVTVALFLVAALLLALLIVFLRRDPRESPGIAAGPAPVIERVEERAEPAPPADPVVELGLPENAERPAEPAPPENPEERPAGSATARLFFVKVSDEGKIGIKGVLRTVPDTGSPLTTAINALIMGPAPGELSADTISLIPEDAVLLGARIDGNVAFLDFNEQFRFNALGIEGYRAQVEQIVYTATEFPTVEKVQFLVEGQRIDYLGGEGFWVGGPLGREDF